MDNPFTLAVAISGLLILACLLLVIVLRRWLDDCAERDGAIATLTAQVRQLESDNNELRAERDAVLDYYRLLWDVAVAEVRA